SVSCCFGSDVALHVISTLSLHDALPIFSIVAHFQRLVVTHDTDNVHRHQPLAQPLEQFKTNGDKLPRRSMNVGIADIQPQVTARDRKSTRLNSSHVKISYAVFCLKKQTQ